MRKSEQYMHEELKNIRVGLALVLMGLLFGVSIGISFGVNEEAYKSFIAEGVAANPAVHDANSQDKIWRYAQRVHFHATGISAFSLGLVILVMFTDLTARLKKIAAVFLGFSSLYPLSWFTMFLLAPSIGRGPAHEHVVTEIFAYAGVGGLLLGGVLLCANLFLGLFGEKPTT